jgi:hypothetical protein
VGPAYAAKLVAGLLRKANTKDVVLSVATVVLLAIVLVQSKVLVSSRPLTTAQLAAEQARAKQAPDGVVVPVVEESPAPTPAPRTSMKKVASKTTSKSKSAAPHPAATEVVVPYSTVQLAVRHQFKDAMLSVWVDDKLTLQRPLHGGTQKRLVVFSGVRGIESETLKVPAGKHTLRFRTQTPDETLDLSRTISSDFIGGNDRTLQISFDKHNTAMRLEWQ